MGQELTYEQAMSRLEEIILRLEQNQLDLNASMELFAEGAKLAASLNNMLEQAKLTVETLFPGQE